MAQLLTLSQVRGSPLFAWHPLGYLMVDGELFRAVHMEPPASVGYRGVLRVERSHLGGDERLVTAGWSHAEGCSCELCVTGAPATPAARDRLAGLSA